MNEKVCSRHIVLIGVGHTNAHIVRMWGMKKHEFPDTDLTCISDNGIATYSGMLPAVLAGQIPEDAMQIDLVRLCSSVGARLIIGDVTGIDHDQQEVLFVDRPSVSFDVLSVGIGSVPSIDGVEISSDTLLKIKPMQTFLPRLKEAVNQIAERHEARKLKVLVVGSGVAGIEILFCLPGFLKQHYQADFVVSLATRSEEVLPGLAVGTRNRVLREIKARGIQVKAGRSITKVADRQAILDDNTSIDADIVIWATGAVAPPSLARLELPLDDRGFIATDATLRSTSGKPIFAVGDSGTIVSEHLPKAGVYAVRQGPVLWQNLRKSLDGHPLERYEPQRSFLKLINRGDGRAVAEWKGWSFSGRWAMKLKDWIDARFMEKYQPKKMASADDDMQCRGCGCKLGATELSAALAQVHRASTTDLKLDDAAEIGTGDSDRLVASTDFFSSPFDDAYLTGKIAALHSASDIVATGADVTQALANVVLPEGDRRTQQKMLGDFLAGAREEFAVMGGDIVGGHTIVGPRFEVGFTVIGKPIGTKLLRKESLAVGDKLYLTKPLGIGVLLAAHMRSECKASDHASLIEAIVQRQQQLARIAVELDITAGTDVTGFGLAGHLLEMLTASEVIAEVTLQRVPLLPGVEEAIDKGISSSLAPDNRTVSRSIEADDKCSPSYDALFDPQTCGGLLLGVSESVEELFVERVEASGLPRPVCIGVVTGKGSCRKPLTLR